MRTATAAAGAAPAAARFAAAMKNPAAAQRAILQRTLRAGAPTAYGRLHQFASIRDEREYAERVPLVTVPTGFPSCSTR